MALVGFEYEAHPVPSGSKQTDKTVSRKPRHPLQSPPPPAIPRFFRPKPSPTAGPPLVPQLRHRRTELAVLRLRFFDSSDSRGTRSGGAALCLCGSQRCFLQNTEKHPDLKPEVFWSKGTKPGGWYLPSWLCPSLHPFSLGNDRRWFEGRMRGTFPYAHGVQSPKPRIKPHAMGLCQTRGTKKIATFLLVSLHRYAQCQPR